MLILVFHLFKFYLGDDAVFEERLVAGFSLFQLIELVSDVQRLFFQRKALLVHQYAGVADGVDLGDDLRLLVQHLQAKLLSALQSRQIRRIGDHQMTPVDIRLICATNMPLHDMVRDNQFRQDLLYRINTVEIKLPPLQDRPSDIPLLVEHFLADYTRKYQKPKLRVKAETLQKLQAYPWPGNIRELRHAVERAVILTESQELGIADFILQPPPAQDQGQPSEELDTYNLAAIERWAIRKALTKHAGNISRAAEELGLTRAALYRRMAKYDL